MFNVYTVMLTHWIDGLGEVEMNLILATYSEESLAIKYIKNINAKDYINELELDELEDIFDKTNGIRRMKVLHEQYTFHVKTLFVYDKDED